jgi:hypothetical protein
MNTISLDEALETVMQLPPDQQEMLIDIVRHRQVERKRQEIADDAQESLVAFRAGKLKPRSSEDEVIVLLDIGTHDEVY